MQGPFAVSMLSLAAFALGIRVKVEPGEDPLGNILSGLSGREGWGLELMGVPLVIHSLRAAARLNGGIDQVQVDPRLGQLASEVGREFGDCVVGSTPDEGDGSILGLPSDGTVFSDGSGGIRIQRLHEPWDLLDASLRTLRDEVNETVIAGSAVVAKTAVISGPCYISEGAMVDDFCKISGPVYIGPRTKVWTGSLIRDSMVGPDCEIGFGCEVGRTYMLGSDRVAHHDVILDSVLGRGAWMGAFIGTTNKLLNNANVKYMKEGRLVDTGRTHFGAVFGHDSAIGAGSILLPGRFVPPGTIVQANTLYTGQ